MRRSLAAAHRSKVPAPTKGAAQTLPIVNLTLPALYNPLEAGVQRAITQGTWQGSIASNRVWHLQCSGYTNGERAPANTVALYTPEQSILSLQTRVVEEVFDATTGQSYFAASPYLTVQAAAPPFVATQVTATSTFVQNTAITSYTPVTASGRPGPLRVLSISPALPTGLAIVSTASGTPPANEGTISGTPTGTQTSTAYTITWKDDSTGDQASNTTAIVINAAAAQPLAAAPLPTNIQIGGFSGTYDGTSGSTRTGGDGLVRLGPVADPGSLGGTVDIHRVVQGDTQIYGGVRAEMLWENQATMLMAPGTDYWFAIGIRIKGDEWYTTQPAGENDELLVFQTHTQFNGDTQPPFSICMANVQSHFQQMRITRSWQTAAPVSGSTNNNVPTGGVVNVYDGTSTLPALDTWSKFIIHIRTGWLASHNPIMEVWLSRNHAAYAQIVNDSGYNDYNDGGDSSKRSYPRKGLYKYTTNYWHGTTKVALYITPLYSGQGTNLYARAEAALAAW